MTSKFVFLLTAATLILGASNSVLAQQATDRDPYRLSASVMDGLEGSGSEDIDGAQSLPALNEDGGAPTVAVNSSNDSKDGKPDPALQASAEAKSDKAATEPKKASAEEGVSKAEVGVDWSGYASALADRWFTNLKNLEYVSKKVWVSKGPAQIQYTCYRDGRIGRIMLRKSCGNPAYDNMQIEALKRCMPLGPFPEGSKRTSYTLLQGWEAHPKKQGESDFKPGSYGKNFPVEKVPLHTKVHGK